MPSQKYKPVILVTGCSSGIGLALAKLLQERTEYRVAITARAKSVATLQNEFQEDDRFWILPLDVTNEAERSQVVQKIHERWGSLDILVNNAGICYRSVLEEMLDKDEHVQMETNYFGPISLIRHVLPKMRQKGRGKIINISSMSGILAMPTMASYSASKYALEGATEALWYETRPFGIDVSLIQPAFVRSKSFERVKFSLRSQISNTMDKPYSDMYKHMSPFISKLMNHGMATPQSIADLVLCVIKTQKPPLWIPASLDAELLYYLRRFLPRRLLQPILYSLLPGSSGWSRRFSRKRRIPNFLVRTWRAVFPSKKEVA